MTTLDLHNSISFAARLVSIISRGGSMQFKLRLDGLEDSILQDKERKVGLYNIIKLMRSYLHIEFRKRKLVELLKKLKRANNKIAIWTVPTF